MNWVTRVINFLWGLWAWVSFSLACLFSLLVALLVPGNLRRQKLVTFAARMVFVLAGVRVTVRGMDNLPLDSCVVVANHASYIDGVLLNGYLPARFGFVIKGEMRNIPVVHFLLRRSGRNSSNATRLSLAPAMRDSSSRRRGRRIARLLPGRHLCSRTRRWSRFAPVPLLQRSKATCRSYRSPFRVRGK